MSWSALSERDALEFFDAPAEVERKAREAAALLRAARHAIVFTGAGISTAAGVPDFRSGT